MPRRKSTSTTSTPVDVEDHLQQRHAQSQRVSVELVQNTAARNDLARRVL